MKLLAVLFATTQAVAAPVPKQTAKAFGDFGKGVDTRGVTCDMTKSGELRVGMSKESTSKSNTHSVARPLVTRTVEGDFELTVRVTHAPPKADDLVAIGRGDPIASAEIAFFSPDDPKASLVLLHRHFRESNAWESTFSLFSRYGNKGSDSSRVSEKLLEQPIYLRLTRRGDEFTSSQSFDGEKWSSIFGASHEMPGLGSVSIGPVAVHNTNGRYDVTFDVYDLKPLKKGEKK